MLKERFYQKMPDYISDIYVKIYKKNKFKGYLHHIGRFGNVKVVTEKQKARPFKSLKTVKKYMTAITSNDNYMYEVI